MIESEEQIKLNIEIEKSFKDRIAVLAIAYHNLGVEQEFLKLVSLFQQNKILSLKTAYNNEVQTRTSFLRFTIHNSYFLIMCIVQ